MGTSCFIVPYVYLDRFSQRQPSLPINSFNVHRMLITSVMVAPKFMDDMPRLQKHLLNGRNKERLREEEHKDDSPAAK
ncbi:Cyclin PHO80-like protein [Corchorus olitorius]|uniref:Cyclin PHO80-like protein n=1 Tax=Corchorus olitorius TaxID=93759 RepID=A0A1R3JXL4_9ROSI|nr:Cyclin PHO80-like protein [Corchorus olitorius]